MAKARRPRKPYVPSHSDIAQMTRLITALTQEIDTARAEREVQFKRIAQIQQELDNIKKAWEQMRGARRSQGSGTTVANAPLHDRAAALRRELEYLQEIVAELQRRSLSQREQQRNQLARIKSEIDHLERKCAELAAHIHEACD